MILDWIKEFPAAVTVCDKAGIVLEMNDKAIRTFADWGGAKLIGTSLQDCHKPSSWAKIQEILSTQIPNTYTIEKNGVHKLIHQQVWYQDGELAGIVEISMEIPQEMPHYVRS